METTELDLRNLSESLRGIPENTPLVMLNLLRYHEHAQYEDGSELGHRSGREAYFEGYVPAFNRVAAVSESTRKIRPIFVGSVLAGLVGPENESWDDVALVEYPDIASFRAIVESREYERDASPHRKAALRDWRLTAMLKQL